MSLPRAPPHTRIFKKLKYLNVKPSASLSSAFTEEGGAFSDVPDEVVYEYETGTHNDDEAVLPHILHLPRRTSYSRQRQQHTLLEANIEHLHKENDSMRSKLLELTDEIQSARLTAVRHFLSLYVTVLMNPWR